MTDQQMASVAKLLELLLNGAYARNKQGTLAQFLTVLLACTAEGITAVEVSRALGQNESSVSRAIKRLGPEGTGCLEMEGRVIRPSAVVIEEINAMFPKD